jgi:hypothetical protein
VIAFFLHFALCAFDLDHCLSLAWTDGGPRCVEVTERPVCESTEGWHYVLGTSVCTRACGSAEL